MTTAQLLTWVKKNPLPVGCGLVSIVLAVASFLRSDAISEATTELEQRSAEAGRYAQNLTNATSLTEQYDQVTADRKEIESRLIHAGEIGINQQYFYKLESQFGVKLSELRQGGRHPAKATYIPISFALTVQGSFPAVVGFLQAVEHGAHFCRVQSAVCSGDRTGPVTLVLTFELLGQP